MPEVVNSSDMINRVSKVLMHLTEGSRSSRIVWFKAGDGSVQTGMGSLLLPPFALLKEQRSCKYC